MSKNKQAVPGNQSLQDEKFGLGSGAGIAADIRNGDTAALAKGITLVESNNPSHHKDAQELIEASLNRGNSTLRIGITGVPGVGKSTFIDTFGTHLTKQGKKVAVLAVDPTSTLSKGSILGDKTRMPNLAVDPNAFIRPSPSGDSLGGVARKTREAIILCEAAGFDVIIVETVGVGQSEIAVHSMVDFFLLLKISGAGDELQGIKRGIMEMADAIVITKADGENIKRANHAKLEFTRALELYPPKANGWKPLVFTASALDDTGISDVIKSIFAFEKQQRKSGAFVTKRGQQNTQWMEQTLHELLMNDLRNSAKMKDLIALYRQKVSENKISPFRAAEELVKAQRKAN